MAWPCERGNPQHCPAKPRGTKATSQGTRCRAPLVPAADPGAECGAVCRHREACQQTPQHLPHCLGPSPRVMTGGNRLKLLSNKLYEHWNYAGTTWYL